ADARFAKPSIDFAKTMPFQQFSPDGIALPGLFRRQGFAAVQPHEHQLGMDFANVARAMRTHEHIDFHDLRSEMPELARDTRLVTAQRCAVRLVGIVKVLPEPSPRAGEDTRNVRAQYRARQQVAGALAVIGHADRNVDTGAVERPG